MQPNPLHVALYDTDALTLEFLAMSLPIAATNFTWTTQINQRQRKLNLNECVSLYRELCATRGIEPDPACLRDL